MTTSRLLLQVLPDCGLERWGRIGAGLVADLAEGRTERILVVASLAQPGVLLGRHQRARSAVHVDRLAGLGQGLARRLGGGRSVLVGPGSVAILVAAPAAGLSVAASPDRVLNRMVRGLRRGLELAGAARKVVYTGRDFLASAGGQIAVVSHEGLPDGAAVFEAIVASGRALALPPDLVAYPEHGDPRSLGPPHQALASRPLEAFAGATGRAYAEEHGLALETSAEGPREAPPQGPPVIEDEEGWERSGVADVPIGFAEALVRAVPGIPPGAGPHPTVSAVRFRGDFIAPAFVMRGLETSLEGCPLTFEEIGRRVDAAFGQPGAVIHGVTRLRVFADAVMEAANAA